MKTKITLSYWIFTCECWLKSKDYSLVCSWCGKENAYNMKNELTI